MTREECLSIERELDDARKKYNEEHEPCRNIECTFHSERKTGNCSFYHYYADECNEYKLEE